MKRLNKTTTASAAGQPALADHGADADAVGSERKCGLNLMKLMGVFLLLVMGLSVLFSVSVVLRDPPLDGLWTVVEARHLDFKLQKGIFCLLKSLFLAVSF